MLLGEREAQIMLRSGAAGVILHCMDPVVSVRTRFLVLTCASLLLSACSSSEKREGVAPNAILITVDTLRADRLGPYGYGGTQTAAINQLAADGVLFKQAIVQVPLTLPSHCSILTGQWPSTVGVRDQAGFTLAPDRPTLASVLKHAGLETAAFVGSSILNVEMGLGQGFDTYTNVLPRPGGTPRGGDLERRGDQVIGDAVRWIETPGRRRFFVWIHLFDPHTPYAPPEPYRTKFANSPYDGEVAFVDSLIGELIGALAAKGLYNKTLVVFTSDHGESLGEHGEETHGFFLYDATVHVPLIVKFPGSRWKGRVVGDQVRGIDVAPTILETLGVAVPAQVQGQALGKHAAGEQKGAAPPAFSETYYPYYHFGWSPLFSIRTAQYKYIRAPEHELYNLSADPRERNNIVLAEAAAASQLRAQLAKGYTESSSVGAPKRKSVDAATLAKLKSLGYIGSGAPRGGTRSGQLADPKDKIRVYTMLERALREGEQGRLRESNARLRQVLREDSSIIDAHLNLGVNLAQLGNTRGAVNSFRHALNLDPRNVIATYNLALAYARLGKLKEAIAGFSRTLDLDPRQAQARVDLGRAHELKGNTDAAIEVFKRAIADDPNWAEAHYYLGRAYERKGLSEQAQAEMRTAERLGFQEQIN